MIRGFTNLSYPKIYMNDIHIDGLLDADDSIIDACIVENH
jgi:hypothetical protein